MNITIEQLESLLTQQKELVIEKLTGNSSQYNAGNTASQLNSLNINWEAMKKLGMTAQFPEEFKIIKKYSL